MLKHPDDIPSAADVLKAEWPKKCGNCKTLHEKADWDRLQLVTGPQSKDGRRTDAYCTLEMRNCQCGSTLAVMMEIHNPSEE